MIHSRTPLVRHGQPCFFLRIQGEAAGGGKAVDGYADFGDEKSTEILLQCPS
jgi:hypothetical protein